MLKEHQLVSIFCQINDFCKELNKNSVQPLLCGPIKSARGPVCCLSVSEIMTVQILFQMVGYRNFKTFYTGFLTLYWRKYFPRLPSYQRFVELIGRAIFPLTIFAQCNSGRKTGLYYIDASCLPVCHIKRSKPHQVFKAVAKYGYTSVGWFFGLKIHLVINHQGELITFKFTKGNRHDSVAAQSLLDALERLAFGDKGYISKKLFEELFKKGLKLITRKRRNINMKEKLNLTSDEKQLLNQRNLIETVFDHLKHHYHLWHTRHRSMLNAMTSVVAALAAYTLEPLKLSAFKLLTKKPPALAQNLA